MQQAERDQQAILQRARYWTIASILLLIVPVMLSLREIVARNKALAQEIKEREQAEKELRASEEKFFKAFDSSPDCIGIA